MSADVEGETSVRNAVMESFTQNNPSQCLSADDAEGVQTLYPDCDGFFYSTAPNCIKVNLNFGAVRMFLYLGIPLLVVVWVMLVFDYVSLSFAGPPASHKRPPLGQLASAHSRPVLSYSSVCSHLRPLAADLCSLWTTTSAFPVHPRLNKGWR